MAKKKETEIAENEVLQGNPFAVTENPQQTNDTQKEELINAINILIAAINIAQSKGAYNIEEAGEIWTNIQKIHSLLQA